MRIRSQTGRVVAGFAGAAALAIVMCVELGCQPATSRADFAPDRPGRLVRLADGRRINLLCSGHGTPTVLLEGGFAATSLAWEKVQPQVARTTRVCSYDRAGYGLSDAGPFPRDGVAVARDLDGALRAAGVGGPFVVVGHSAGALYMRIFAARRHEDIVGMVLVDPSPDHEDARLAVVGGPGAGSLAGLRERAALCLAAADRGALPSTDASLAACSPKSSDPAEVAQAIRADNWRTQISELDTMWGATSDEVEMAPAHYGAMPLIVLTADGSFSDAPEPLRSEVMSLWIGLHQQIAALSSRGSERVVKGSSHVMMFDRPDAIVAAIDEVVVATRSPH